MGGSKARVGRRNEREGRKCKKGKTKEERARGEGATR